MPPPAATTLAAPAPQQVPQPAVPQSPSDPICGYLLGDPVFVAAVKRQDVTQAAQAAAKTIKHNLHAIIARIKPQQSAAVANFLSGAGSGVGVSGGGPHGLPAHSMPPLSQQQSAERRLSDDGRYKCGGSCEPGDGPGGLGRVRELRRGDWVVIRSANKSTDPELLGQDAWVAQVEHNGWVELQVPKLGRTVKLQQRYLTLIPPAHPMVLGPAPGGPGALGPSPVGLPPPRPRAASEASGGMGPPGSGAPYVMDERPYKRPHMDPSVRPALSLDVLPPARAAATPSAAAAARGGSTRFKELVRSIRRELLAVEESIPWNCVVPSWAKARPGWRRSLQRLTDSPTLAAAPQTVAGSTAAPPPAVAASGGSAAAPLPLSDTAAAAASAALAALVSATAASMLELHDALLTEKSHGLFARRGGWETRLKELADGGNNHSCLQVLWSEMAEGIKVYMAAGGGAPPSAAGTPLPGPAGLPSFRSFESAAGDSYGGSATPRDPFGPASRLPPDPEPDYYMQVPPLSQHHHQSLSTPFGGGGYSDYGGGGLPPAPGSARAGPPPPTAPGSARAAAAMAMAQGGVPPPPLASWVVRSELSQLMAGIEGEMDTDCDDGPDATDVEEDSDAELTASPARKQRKRQQLEPAEPAPPAAVQPIAAAAAATATVATTTATQQQLDQGTAERANDVKNQQAEGKGGSGAGDVMEVDAVAGAAAATRPPVDGKAAAEPSVAAATGASAPPAMAPAAAPAAAETPTV